MGEVVTWKCFSCKYKAFVSGRKDCGFISFTQTFQCDKCKELMDITVSESEWETEQWDQHYCEKCKKVLKPWNTDKRPCPCCGVKMFQTIGDFCHWD